MARINLPTLAQTYKEMKDIDWEYIIWLRNAIRWLSAYEKRNKYTTRPSFMVVLINLKKEFRNRRTQYMKEWGE